MDQGKVFFIGAGPGDPKLITVRGREVLEAADLVVYAGSLVNPQLLAWARPDARILDSAGMALPEIAHEMITAARSGAVVARLHTGDPSLYGAIAEQIDILEKEHITFEIIPGVSSAFAAAAALNIEYTLPDSTQTLILTRRAGRTKVPARESLASLAGHRASMAVFLSTGMVDAVVRELIAGGYADTTPAAVVYRASWPDEGKVTGTLGTIAALVKAAGFSRQALILVGDAVGRKPAAPSRLYDPAFGHGYRQAAKKNTAVVAVTRRGYHTARRLMRGLNEARLYVPLKFQDGEQDPSVSFYEDVKQTVAELFFAAGHLVLVMAAGIAVRLIAPHLTTKWHDPAVVVLDDSGANVVSLLSGHWGGANDLAEKIAAVLGARPVVTTASDVSGYPALDLLVKALGGGRPPADPALLARIQASMLGGQDVGFYPKAIRYFPGMTDHHNLHFFDSVEELYLSGCTAGLIASGHAGQPFEVKEQFPVVQVRDIVIGIGCHRGTQAREIQAGIAAVLADLGLGDAAVARVCTIDRKGEEPGLRAYCSGRGLPLTCYSAGQLNALTTPSPTSRHALRVMGVRGVAEPCAVLGAMGGELLARKKKLENMTLAVARIPLRELLEQVL